MEYFVNFRGIREQRAGALKADPGRKNLKTMNKFVKGLLFISIILLYSSVFAQNDWQFVDESNLRLPDTIAVGYCVDAGDLNNNGRLDILNACVHNNWPYIPGYEHLYFGTDSGYFSIAQNGEFPLINDESSSVLLFDCDADSDLDAFVVNFNYRPDYIALNNGFGEFSIDWNRINADSSTSIIANYGDIDNDGDIDIVMLGNALSSDNAHRVWINYNNLSFGNEPFRLPELNLIYSTVEFADVDNDLDVDLLVNDRWDPGQPRMLINNGEGYFDDQTDLRFPPLQYSQNSNFIDLDNDNDFDIIMGYQGRCGFLINNGVGIFADETLIRGPEYPPNYSPSKMKSADFDNDGDEDILLGMQGSRDFVFINIGSGFYEDQSISKLPNHIYDTRGIILADFDEDGDIDYFRTGSSSTGNTIYINTLNTPDTLTPEIKRNTVFSQIVRNPGPYSAKIICTDGVSIENSQLYAKIHYSFDSLTSFDIYVRYTGGYMFYGEIPAVDSGATVYYYYTCEDNSGNIVSMPNNFPDSVFSFIYLPNQTGIDNHNNLNLPDELKLTAYPNPFNSSTTITLNDMRGGDVEIRIYDIRGRLIKTLLSGIQGGDKKAVWDATDNSGRSVSSGIYFARVETPHSVKIQKLLYLR